MKQITIGTVTTTRINYNNHPVISTAQLSEFYGASENSLTKNFSLNQDRFKEGIHYFKLEGANLSDFKKGVMTNGNDPFKYVSVLILWTEKGAARHAKMLTSDKAWEVWEKLEDTYFKVQQGYLPVATVAPVPPVAMPYSDPLLAAITYSKAAFELAQLYGFKGNQAILAADAFARSVTGESPLKLMKVSLISQNKGLLYNATELGKLCTPVVKPIAMNLKLSKNGFQVKDAVTDDWAPTDKAMNHCEFLDVGKQHSNGTPIKQLKWYATVLPLLT